MNQERGDIKFPWWMIPLCVILKLVEGPPEPGVVHAELITAILVSLAMAAVSLVLSELLRPKPDLENAKPAANGDFNFPTAEEGRPVPLVWGTAKQAGPNVIWWGDLVQQPIKKKIKTGLWSSKSLTTGYRYNVGIQMALARSGISGAQLKRIWVGDKVIFSGTVNHEGTVSINEPEFLGGDEFGSGGIVGTVRFHDGRYSQAVNSYLGGFQSPLPGYSGTIYAVFEGGYIGNSTSIRPWALEINRFPDNLGLTGSHHIVNSVDANPAEVLYEWATNAEWGLGLLSSKIDIASFQAAGETLFTEGNGLSLVLDREMVGTELRNLILSQIDGVLVEDKRTGKLKLKLARDDYDIDLVPELTGDNILEIRDFSRQCWDGTTNQVRINFSDRARDYFKTSAKSDDIANQRMQENEIVSTTIEMPGVKDRTLATALAARELRFLSLPLAKINVTVNREFWETHPGDVLAFTDEDLGFDKLPVRVMRVDDGNFSEGTITLGLMQDIFSLESGFFGEPADTGWVQPTQDVAAFPEAQSVVMEAPKGIVDRDPLFPDRQDRLFCAARRQSAEISFGIYQRNDPTTPAGAYELDGEVYGLMLIGELNVALNTEDANPTTAITLNSDIDSISAIQSAFDTLDASSAEIGQQLANLILIGNEFIGAEGFSSPTGTTIVLDNCYRGLLDSAPADHAAGASVFLLFVASGLNEAQIPPGNEVEVKLRGESRDDILAEGSAPTISLTMSDRYRRPYVPYRLDIDTIRFDTTVDIDDPITGSGLDAFGLNLEWYRRDYRTADEVASLQDDAGVLDATFPSANTHQNRVRILRGSDSLQLWAEGFITGNTDTVSRTNILALNNGVIPSTIMINVGSRHTVDSVVYESRYELSFETTPSSADLTGLFNWGTLPANVASAAYTVDDDTVDHDFAIGTALAANIEYRINAGAWTTLIAAGLTTGTILNALLSPGDVIYIRHLDSGGSPTNTLLVLTEDGGSDVAYAILHTGADLNALTGYWNLDESSGDRARTLGVARALDDTNTVTAVAGVYSNAARLQQLGGPVQEYLRLPNAEAGDLIPVTGQSFTMTCWVKPTTLNGTLQYLVSILDLAGGAAAYTGRVCSLEISTANRIRAVVHDAAGGFNTGSEVAVTLSAGTWYLAALVYEAGSTQYTAHLIPQGGARTAGPTRVIGAGLNAAGANTIIGVGAAENAGVVDTASGAKDLALDEVRLYHRALSTTNLEALAAQTGPFG